MSYSDGRFYTRQSVALADIDSNAAAASLQAGWKNQTAIKILELTAHIKAAGTATNAGWTVFKNSASIGVFTAGTATAGAFVDASFTDTTFAAGDSIQFKNITSDTSLLADISIDYQETFA